MVDFVAEEQQVSCFLMVDSTEASEIIICLSSLVYWPGIDMKMLTAAMKEANPPQAGDPKGSIVPATIAESATEGSGCSCSLMIMNLISFSFMLYDLVVQFVVKFI